MKNFKNIFRKKTLSKPTEQSVSLTALIGPGLEKLAFEIYSYHWGTLVEKPIEYIVPAVWGIMEGSRLDDTQEEIYKSIVPAIDKILSALLCDDMTETQKFAIRYLVNGYLVSRITFIIELSRIRDIKGTIHDTQYKDSYGCFKPVGHA
ncbi:MAG: hypothetical protein JEZ12_28600 [Desulfobacterium sp.]|nr:hypothetical protein [Desulfobacterium sp.]